MLPQHGSSVIGAQLSQALTGLPIVWRLVGELDAEMPAAGKTDDDIG